MTRDLGRLLRPSSIAVVGGGGWCANVVEGLAGIGFEGPVWPVHPMRDTVGGRPAVRTIADLPGIPDAVFVGVNRQASVEVVRELAALGAGGAVCFASGFREADAETGDGAALQQALLEAAGDMPILGPNCYGVVNYLDRTLLWPDIHGGAPVDRGVAILSQSSNIAINLTMQRRGLPVAYVVTVGNQAQISLSELGAALLADGRVTALGMYVEGIGDIRAFEGLAQEARRLGKRIVVVKVGASELSRAATVSHTASLAGSEAGAQALFARLGVAQVATLAELIETLKLLHAVGPLRSDRIASMSCSGGEASLMADLGAGRRIVYPPLDEGQRTALRSALGPKVALANPLDYNTYIWGDTAALTRCYAAMMAGDLALGLVVLDFPRADRCPAPLWDCVVEAVAEAGRLSGKPLGLLASIPETMPEEVAARLLALGIPALSGMEEGLAAVEAAAFLGAEIEEADAVLVPGRDAAGIVTLTEGAAKAALAERGLVVPSGRSVRGAEAASQVAAEIGFPVALKGVGLAHKTEAGAVALDLGSREAVLAAAQGMGLTEFHIEEMIEGTVAELLVGVVRDPAHGFVLTLAAGGVHAELLKDRVSLLLPVSDGAIATALHSLRIWPVLAGYRGKAGANLPAIVAAVQAVAAFIVETADSAVEVEVNPLVCTETRAVAVDALIRMGEPE
jgi:acyl-CoA synthetase (NDP forming)